MKKTIFQVLIFFFSTLNLASCGVYSSKFNSTPAVGLYNKSLSKVDALIDAGILDQVVQNEEASKNKLKISDQDIVFLQQVQTR